MSDSLELTRPDLAMLEYLIQLPGVWHAQAGVLDPRQMQRLREAAQESLEADSYDPSLPWKYDLINEVTLVLGCEIAQAIAVLYRLGKRGLITCKWVSRRQVDPFWTPPHQPESRRPLKATEREIREPRYEPASSAITSIGLNGRGFLEYNQQRKLRGLPSVLRGKPILETIPSSGSPDARTNRGRDLAYWNGRFSPGNVQKNQALRKASE